MLLVRLLYDSYSFQKRQIELQTVKTLVASDQCLQLAQACLSKYFSVSVMVKTMIFLIKIFQQIGWIIKCRPR